MKGSMLVLTAIFISRIQQLQSCVHLVQRFESKSYTVSETSCKTHSTHCFYFPYDRIQCKEEQYVHVREFKYYFMEAQCCDGYRESREENEIKCEHHNLTMPLSKELNRTLRSMCSCDAPTSKITDIHLLCIEEQPRVLIFQGRLVTTEDRNFSQLEDDLQRISKGKSTIFLFGKELTALQNCTCCTIIEESELGSPSSAETCISAAHNSETSNNKLNDGEVVGMAVGSITLILITVTVIIIVGYQCRKRWRRRDHQHLGGNHGGEGPGRL